MLLPPHLLTLTRTHTDNPAGSGLVQGSWRPDSSFWSWLPRGHSHSHPFTQTQGLLRDCHGLTAVALALYRVLLQSPDDALHPGLV